MDKEETKRFLNELEALTVVRREKQATAKTAQPPGAEQPPQSVRVDFLAEGVGKLSGWLELKRPDGLVESPDYRPGVDFLSGG